MTELNYQLRTQPHWHIIGQGAIGLLAASLFNKNHHPVSLIVKNQTEQVQGNVHFNHLKQQLKTFTVKLEPYNTAGPIDRLLVPLKAYDIVTAIKQVKPRLHSNSLIVLCHNGMGTIETVQALLGPQQPLIFATTTHGAYRRGLRHVVHCGLGDTKLGWISGQNVSNNDTQLNSLLSPVSWHQNINHILWQKLAINCVINPLTALAQCHNGVLAQPQYESIINQLCQEVSAVAMACQQPLNSQQLQATCYQVIKATATNFSSMHQDVKAQRQTEIDFITGYLIDQANKVNIKVPHNLELFERIKQL